MQSTTADPYKISWYREAARAYSECRAAGGCDTSDPRLFEFLRMLIKTPEHTYGAPDFYDDSSWTNAAFHAAIAQGETAYTDVLSTYTEQRDIVAREGVRFLADHPLAAVIAARVADLTPKVPDVSSLTAVPPAQWGDAISVPVAGGGPAVQIGLDAATGALTTLVLAGEAWADAAHPMGALAYRTFNDADLATQGSYCCWGHDARQAAARPNSTSSSTTLAGVWVDSATSPTALTARMVFDPTLNEFYGAPGEVWATYSVTSAGSVNFTLQIFNKTATRLAEAALLHFVSRPGAGAADAAWLMRKLESWVDPLDGAAGGSPHQHVVSDGVRLTSRAAPDGPGPFFAVDSLDAAVFSPATPTSAATNFIVPFDALQGPVLGFGALLWQNALYVGHSPILAQSRRLPNSIPLPPSPFTPYSNTNTPLFTFDSAFKWRFVLRAGAAA